MTATGAHDPFLALGVPPRLDLDEAELERRVLELQRRHHPDRVPPEERDAAEARAADVNAAYRALRSPLARAKAWLELRGVRLDAFRGGPPGPLAMRGFEIQEAAEELRAGSEVAAETLRALERAVAADRSAALADLKARFAREPEGAVDGAHPFAAEIARAVIAMNYLNRQAAQIAEATEET